MDGAQPFTNAGFPRIDFLTAANKTHHDGPVWVTI
jgi:hypothetical protein